MKKIKTIYWISTALCMLIGGASAPYYFTAEAAEKFRTIGFPDFFRIELAIAKMIGLIIILIPAIPARVKEWAYVGFGITFISAIILHSVVDGPIQAIAPFVALTLLSISYSYYHKLQQLKNLQLQKA